MSVGVRLLTEPEYQAAMKRIDELMNDEQQKPGGELDTLVDQAVAYEALDAAALALIADSKVYTATHGHHASSRREGKRLMASPSPSREG